MSARRWVLRLERAWDAARLRRAGSRVPEDFRIVCYGGHGSAEGVVVRGRVVDDPPPSAAVEDEGAVAAVRRMVRHFVTDELPGVPLRITVGDAAVDAVTDDEGYFVARLHPSADKLEVPWTRGTVELAGEYRGLDGVHRAEVEVSRRRRGSA